MPLLPRRVPGRFAALPAFLAAIASAFTVVGCASTGATFRSGVGDTDLEHPPYYAGRSAPPVVGTVGHLPVAYQRGGSQAAIFDPGASEAMHELLARMNARLDALGRSALLAEGGRVSAVTHAATRVPPDVRFGCATGTGFPDDDCEERDDGIALGRRGQTMRLAVGRPSAEWTAWAGDLMAGSGVEATLVVTLEVGQYLLRQRGLRGTKEVELGTSHVERLPWLTSLETPVTVLQLTGALVGPDGRATRIGAEGLLARRTRMSLSGIGAQELLTDEDVERLLTERREDLPGAPLVWEAGLDALVAGLLGPRSADAVVPAAPAAEPAAPTAGGSTAP